MPDCLDLVTYYLGELESVTQALFPHVKNRDGDCDNEDNGAFLTGLLYGWKC